MAVVDHSTNRRGFFLALPGLAWLVLFFLIPLVAIAAMSFASRGASGQPVFVEQIDGITTSTLTLDNYERATGSIFRPVLLRSMWIAALTTAICLIIGYPLAFFISTLRHPRLQQIALFLIILPFWTNFLVRIYAWQILLSNEGVINTFLMNVGWITEPIMLLNTQFAVILGLVYGFLPFMVLPVYASIERFDFHFVDAAHDLGANDLTVFWRVVLPLTLPGVIAGSALVFIPSVGAYVAPALLGGTRGLMIGNLIAREFGGSGGNMPFGAALSIIMMSVVMITLVIYLWVNRTGQEEA